MAKFRKKPVVIEAELYDGTPASVDRIMEMGGTHGINNSEDGLYIVTLEGIMRADRGDWIIQGVKKELYPCRNDIFLMTYEKVE